MRTDRPPDRQERQTPPTLCCHSDTTRTHVTRAQQHNHHHQSNAWTDLGVELLVDAVSDLDVGVRGAQVRDAQVLGLEVGWGEARRGEGGGGMRREGVGEGGKRRGHGASFVTPPSHRNTRHARTHREDGEHEDADGRRVAEPLQVDLLHHGDDELGGVEEEALMMV